MKTKLFDEVKNMEDFKKVVEEHIDDISQRYFIESGVLELALKSLSSFSKEQEQRFLKFLKHIDKAYHSPGSAKGNAFHKFPSVFSASVYYRYYPEQVESLTLEEMTLLTRFSCVEKIDFYKTSVDRFGKELLSTIVTKTPDKSLQIGYLELANEMINKENKTKDEAVEHIQTSSNEQLKEEVDEFDRKLFENVNIHY